MGDRANVAIYDWSDDAVVLYTHWGGTELPLKVQKALAREQRWDDGAYLARIVFDAMTEGEYGSETGHGILANALSDNSWPVLVLDTKTQRIAARDEAGWKGQVGPSEGLSFAEFIKLDDPQGFRG